MCSNVQIVKILSVGTNESIISESVPLLYSNSDKFGKQSNIKTQRQDNFHMGRYESMNVIPLRYINRNELIIINLGVEVGRTSYSNFLFGLNSPKS